MGYFVLERDADHRAILYPSLRLEEARRALEEWAEPLRDDFDISYVILADDECNVFNEEFKRWAEEHGYKLYEPRSIVHAVRRYADERKATLAIIKLYPGGGTRYTVYALEFSTYRPLQLHARSSL
jgi:hypothetical protein